MMKVIVAGAAGRMGRRIGYMVDQHPALTYTGAFEAPGSEHIGRDAGELAGVGANGVRIGEGLESVIDSGDVIIDFTFHEATMKIARQAAEHRTAMVIGTTGFTEDQKQAVAAAANRIGPAGRENQAPTTKVPNPRTTRKARASEAAIQINCLPKRWERSNMFPSDSMMLAE